MKPNETERKCNNDAQRNGTNRTEPKQNANKRYKTRFASGTDRRTQFKNSGPRGKKDRLRRRKEANSNKKEGATKKQTKKPAGGAGVLLPPFFIHTNHQWPIHPRQTGGVRYHPPDPSTPSPTFPSPPNPSSRSLLPSPPLPAIVPPSSAQHQHRDAYMWVDGLACVNTQSRRKASPLRGRPSRRSQRFSAREAGKAVGRQRLCHLQLEHNPSTPPPLPASATPTRSRSYKTGELPGTRAPGACRPGTPYHALTVFPLSKQASKQGTRRVSRACAQPTKSREDPHYHVCNQKRASRAVYYPRITTMMCPPRTSRQTQHRRQADDFLNSARKQKNPVSPPTNRQSPRSSHP